MTLDLKRGYLFHSCEWRYPLFMLKLEISPKLDEVRRTDFKWLNLR